MYISTILSMYIQVNSHISKYWRNICPITFIYSTTTISFCFCMRILKFSLNKLKPRSGLSNCKWNKVILKICMTKSIKYNKILYNYYNELFFIWLVLIYTHFNEFLFFAVLNFILYISMYKYIKIVFILLKFSAGKWKSYKNTNKYDGNFAIYASEH